MSKEEIIANLEDMMEVDEGTLSPEMKLDEIEEWDSLSVLLLFSFAKQELGIRLTSDDAKGFKTVQDIIDKLS